MASDANHIIISTICQLQTLQPLILANHKTKITARMHVSVCVDKMAIILQRVVMSSIYFITQSSEMVLFLMSIIVANITKHC